MEAIAQCQRERGLLIDYWPCQNYHFSQFTGLSSLRVHIQNWHLEEYVSHVPGDWANALPYHKLVLKQNLLMGRISDAELLRESQFTREGLQNVFLYWMVADDEVSICITQ